MSARVFISSFTLLVLSAAATLGYQNCSTQKITQAQFPPLGALVTLKPISAQKPIKSYNDYAHKLVFFMHESRPLTYDDQFTIQMFDSSSLQNPVYEFSPQQLKDMYRTSNCANSLIHFLHNAAINDALFCNNSLDLSKIISYKVILKDQIESATNYGFNFVSEEDDLVALEIMFD